MKLEHGKTYVTQGGWIVEIIIVQGITFCTKRTSPGKAGGKTISEYVKSNYAAWAANCGWQYYSDGSGVIQSVDIRNEFQIIGEYPFKLPDPPKGYTWAGGFPRIEEPVNGRTYLAGDNFSRAVKMSTGTGWINSPVIGTRRIILEKVYVPTTPKPEHSVEVTYQYYVPTEKYTWGHQNRYFVNRLGIWYAFNVKEQKEQIDSPDRYWQDLIKDGVIVPCTREQAMERAGLSKQEVATSPQHIDEAYYLPHNLMTSAKYFAKKDGKWFYYDSFSGKEIRSNYYNDYWVGQITRGGIMECTKPQAMVAATPPTFSVAALEITGPRVSDQVHPFITKEEQMKSSTFVNIVKSAASRTLGAANHFYVEPAKIIGGYVKRSVRYAVFFGTLTGIVYGVNDPTSLKKKVASCMPKITIEAPDALK